MSQREYRSKAVVFESLFIHQLKAEGAFLADLKAAGFDPAAIQTDYPHHVLNACVAVAHKHLYPELSHEEARWKIGARFTHGVSSTLLGKVILSALPLIGPVRYLKRVPEHMKVDDSGLEATCTIVSAREGRLDFQGNPEVDPEFIAGMVEEGVKLTRVEPQVQLVKHVPGRFSLHIRW